jgi:GNAT superfamily N-acetyltransferase
MAGVQIADDAPQTEYDDPFVRWRIDPAVVSRVHRHGDAAVFELARDRHGRPGDAPHLICLGPAPDLEPLLREAGERMTEVPDHVNIEQHAVHLLPEHWRWDHHWHWDWMWTTAAPPFQPGEDVVIELDLDAPGITEIEALLDVANPGSHGRPARGEGQRWLGIRDGDGRLVATGGMFLLPSGVSHLRGISTLAAMRGRGLGSALSAGLTRVGLGDGGGVCTLGAYSDNTRALEIYRRLGFRHGHSFCSGALAR